MPPIAQSEVFCTGNCYGFLLQSFDCLDKTAKYAITFHNSKGVRVSQHDDRLGIGNCQAVAGQKTISVTQGYNHADVKLRLSRRCCGVGKKYCCHWSCKDIGSLRKK